MNLGIYIYGSALQEALAEIAPLRAQVKIAEDRQRHLEVELAQARVSIESWKTKYLLAARVNP